jgi:hypothetical protein
MGHVEPVKFTDTDYQSLAKRFQEEAVSLWKQEIWRRKMNKTVQSRGCKP